MEGIRKREKISLDEYWDLWDEAKLEKDYKEYEEEFEKLEKDIVAVMSLQNKFVNLQTTFS